jgi:hypothetical protein
VVDVDIPDDPELAFLYLEDQFNQELESAEQKNWGDGGPPDRIFIEYMAKTLSAVQELQLDALQSWQTPLTGDFQLGNYLNFRHDVLQYRTRLEIRFGRRARAFSVKLSAKDKRTIHHYITKIRELIIFVELQELKKERLLNKLSSFENEVDRDRTRLDTFGATLVALAGYGAEVIEKLEPARKWLDSIGALIHGAKEQEEAAAPFLPAAERRRIEAEPPVTPKQDLGSLADELDDEIRF